jgi:archaellum component FlaC
MDMIANLLERIEMKLDDIEEMVDQLEEEFGYAEEGESVDGIRKAIEKLWDELNNIS